jgi:hypothetical protein
VRFSEEGHEIFIADYCNLASGFGETLMCAFIKNEMAAVKISAAIFEVKHNRLRAI